MAPNKFEEHIKTKLEKRTLEPSGQAWEKLSEKLEIDNKKSSSKTLWKLAIAASLVGILFMVNMFFNPSESTTSKPVIVDAEVKEVQGIENSKQIKTDKTLIAVENSKDEVDTTAVEKLHATQIGTSSVNSKTDSTKNAMVAEASKQEEPKETAINTIQEGSLVHVELAEVEHQERERNTVTDIDSLLKTAQQNLAKNADIKNNSIDAQALLQDVEEDIEASFRDKVFETLITGYKKVKTAVVERND
ncbi:hypothetical protein OS188_01710 [Xanthomarina sp. F1114]|uniref:hypothetical protein n=1 Tax=Xanthomarina sp. F1114 TaxID=2996019 RepID=UPI00225E5FDF|nr:hypothetical protein [Xanthomarina sp. F1114]MCX7546663.1 hypothetical protein [Xanthomarina sp. F1114]